MAQPLTFDLLEDVALAACRDRPHDVRLNPPSCIGPLVELRRLIKARILSLPIPPWPAMKVLERSLTSKAGRGLIEGRRSFGFIRAERSSHDGETYLQEFLFGIHRGLIDRGWPSQLSRGLIGALAELEDNIRLHSRDSASGVVGFRLTDDDAEFVVADAGIGVLQSLRSGAYPRLSDSGEALTLALTDGGSRFGRRSGHGFGFRPLFSNLANHWGRLRFRSDDQLLSVTGLSPSLNRARLIQQARLPGLVVHIVCRKPLVG